MINLIKNGEKQELDDVIINFNFKLFTWRVYVYLAGIVILFVLGVIVQSKINDNKNKKSGDDNNRGGIYIKIDNK